MVAQLSRPLAVVGEGELAFGTLLRRLRLRAGLSQNRLARLAGIDPAYVNRFERCPGQSPRRRVVLALWDALEADERDRERLLVAAGLCPEVIVRAGGWDAYLDAVLLAMTTPTEPR